MEIPTSLRHLPVPQRVQQMSIEAAKVFDESLVASGTDRTGASVANFNPDDTSNQRTGEGIRLASKFASVDMAELQKLFMEILFEQRKPLSQVMGESIKNEFVNIDAVFQKATNAAKANLTSELVQAAGSIAGGALSGAGGVVGAGKLGKSGKVAKRAHAALDEAQDAQFGAQRGMGLAKKVGEEATVNLQVARTEKLRIKAVIDDVGTDAPTRKSMQSRHAKLEQADASLNDLAVKSAINFESHESALRDATKEFRAAEKAVKKSDRMMRDAELVGQITRETGSLATALFRVGSAVEKNKADVLQAEQAKLQSVMEINNKLYQTMQAAFANAGDDFKKSLGNIQSLLQMTSETTKAIYRNV